MRMTCLVMAGLVGLVAAAGCDSSEGAGAANEGSGGNAGGGQGAGAPVNCDAPDTACPDSMPFPGAPCAGSLSCTYDEDAIEWNWSCDEGRWDGGPDCSMLIGGCPVPPPAETCADPFEGSMTGAVEVGPATEAGAAFEPFIDGEVPDIEWGGQGSAMVFYRVAIDGEDIPSCVDVEASLTPTHLGEEGYSRPVRLRCGESLRLYLVVPYGTCMETENVDTLLKVSIEGIGETEVMLSIPPDAFCGGFG